MDGAFWQVGRDRAGRVGGGGKEEVDVPEGRGDCAFAAPESEGSVFDG